MEKSKQERLGKLEGDGLFDLEVVVVVVVVVLVGAQLDSSWES